MKDLKAKHDKLDAAWKAKDLNTCKKLLQEIKVLLMTELQFLPTDVNIESQKVELSLARRVLEIGALFSVATEDVDGFERFMAQLKTYYSDFDSVLPESPFKYELLGVNLLCLLCKNKIADFHTELEQLPPDTLQNNVYIQCPVRLEQFIMEGSYNKVLLMQNNVPAESFKLFVAKLSDTIREEMGSCLEKAYEHISMKDCAKLLKIDVKTAQKFVASRGWEVGKDQIIRFHSNEKKDLEEVPTEELAKMAITYAREMEQIV